MAMSFSLEGGHYDLDQLIKNAGEKTNSCLIFQFYVPILFYFRVWKQTPRQGNTSRTGKDWWWANFDTNFLKLYLFNWYDLYYVYIAFKKEIDLTLSEIKWMEREVEENKLLQAKCDQKSPQYKENYDRYVNVCETKSVSVLIDWNHW